MQRSPKLVADHEDFRSRHPLFCSPTATATRSSSRADVPLGGTQSFTAAMTGAHGAVSWSIEEGAATCHVVATSAVDSAKSDTATVAITSAPSGMPHISTGKPAFVSEGTPSALTDGAYRSPNAWTFTPSHCSATTPCWAAVNVGTGPTTLLVDWSYQDGQGDFDALAWAGQTVGAYALFVSADSTNGSDGTWTPAVDTLASQPVVVASNTLTHRTHAISFAGNAWVKMAITASAGNEIDELDLWDASSTTGDSYFFHGDSITHRCANLRGTNAAWGEQPSFQANVQAAHPGHFPLEVGGGTASHSSANAVTEIAKYLPLFHPVKYWLFTMGTNDLCAGAPAFSAHAQTWISAVKAAGGVPILVHPIWANDNASYCSANGPSFNAAVDALVTTNGLAPAVPLYEATVGHPEYTN